MKKWLSNATMLTTALIFGSGIIAGAFFLLKSNQYNDEKSFIKYNTITDNHPTIDVRLEEVNVNFEDETSKKNVYFLGKSGLHELSILIKNNLNYGPELFGLKRIIVGNENFVDKKINGLYIPATQEIHINTRNFINRGFDVTKTPTNVQEQKLRARLLFEIIYHEYGHYLADTYLNSVPIANPLSSSSHHSDIYNSTTHEKENWDYDFTSKFEEILHYTKNGKINMQPYYSKSTPFIKRQQRQKQTPIQYTSKYTSIGKDYSAGKLFDLTNGHETIKYDGINNKKYVFSSNYPIYELTKSAIIDSEKMKYIYSLAEVFTRKYQQLMMNPLPRISPSWSINWSRIASKWGWLIKSGSKETGSATNLMEDALYYQRNLITNSRQERFMEDAPFDFSTPLVQKAQIRFGQKTQTLLTQKVTTSTVPKVTTQTKLYNLMDRHIGHKDGDDISIIWSKNNAHTSIDGAVRHYGGSWNNPNQIRFGGFLKTRSSYNAIAIKTNGKYSPVAKLLFGDYNYKRKTNLLGKIIPLAKTLKNHWFVTHSLTEDKYINVNNVLNKELFFVKINTDGTIDKKVLPRSINSTRTNTNGIASTFRYVKKHHMTTNYQTTIKSGHVIIEESPWK